jgi:hypothetical protein
MFAGQCGVDEVLALSNLFDGIDNGNRKQRGAALCCQANGSFDFLDADKRPNGIVNGHDCRVGIHMLHGRRHGVLPARSALHYRNRFGEAGSGDHLANLID